MAKMCFSNHPKNTHPEYKPVHVRASPRRVNVLVRFAILISTVLGEAHYNLGNTVQGSSFTHASRFTVS